MTAPTLEQLPVRIPGRALAAAIAGYPEDVPVLAGHEDAPLTPAEVVPLWRAIRKDMARYPTCEHCSLTRYPTRDETDADSSVRTETPGDSR